MADADIKIRSLPRGRPKTPKAPVKQAPKKPKSNKPVYAFGAVAVALVGLGLIRTATSNHHAQTRELSSVQDTLGVSVRQSIQDSHFKEGLLRRQRALENIESQRGARGLDQTLASDGDRPLGVQFETDDTSDRLYRELNQNSKDRATGGEALPDDRINARLANRKWVNEEERAERVQYVRNFIKSAYDRGFQVELDQNLVVVGVKRITKKVSIDQVLERLDRQGL